MIQHALQSTFSLPLPTVPHPADTPFPKTFKATAKNILKRLFRVYAHIYCSHIDKVAELGADAHLNTCFKHFVFFVLHFDLVERKELAPLEDLIEKFTAGIRAGGAGAAAGAGSSS